jgi:hypothetical protein
MVGGNMNDDYDFAWEMHREDEARQEAKREAINAWNAMWSADEDCAVCKLCLEQDIDFAVGLLDHHAQEEHERYHDKNDMLFDVARKEVILLEGIKTGGF